GRRSAAVGSQTGVRGDLGGRAEAVGGLGDGVRAGGSAEGDGLAVRRPGGLGVVGGGVGGDVLDDVGAAAEVVREQVVLPADGTDEDDLLHVGGERGLRTLRQRAALLTEVVVTDVDLAGVGVLVDGRAVAPAHVGPGVVGLRDVAVPGVAVQADPGRPAV